MFRDYLSLAGRLLIAREILLAEAGSHLEDRWPQPFDDWLAYLYSRMLEDVQRPDYFWQENAVTFVTFNYDRMLEYKIARALRAQFRLDDVQYAEVLRSARIIHLHGSLGRLEHGEQFVPFGCNAPDPSQMNNHLPEWHLRAAESIKIVHQARADTPEFVDARKALHRAERVVFLGFGFGSKNVERLQFSSIKENASIFLTRLGMTEAEYIRRVRTPMKNAKVREHQLASPPNFGCADLLRANVGALF